MLLGLEILYLLSNGCISGIIGDADPSVVRAIKMMSVNTEPETESRIFAPLWGGAANIRALEKNIKHR